VASTGLSVGGVLVTPLSARLIETRGLASATAILAVILFLGIVPITALVLRPRPEALGLFADGSASDPHQDASSQNGIHYREALRSRFFRFATAAYAFSMLAQVGGIAHQYKLVNGRVDAATAALSVSLLAGSSVVGRLSGGWLLAWVPMRGFTVLLMVAQAGALGVLARGEARGALLGGSIAFGLTVGNILLLQPLLLADRSGGRTRSPGRHPRPRRRLRTGVYHRRGRFAARCHLPRCGRAAPAGRRRGDGRRAGSPSDRSQPRPDQVLTAFGASSPLAPRRKRSDSA
jgi:hypothetical protein